MMFYLLFFLPKLGQLLPEFRDTLALLPMAILRPIPVNLLAGFAAVAVGLASLAKLARGRVQWNAAYLAGLSKGAKFLLKARQMNRFIMRFLILRCRRYRQPKLCFSESIQLKAAIHCVIRTTSVVLESRFCEHH